MVRERPPGDPAQGQKAGGLSLSPAIEMAGNPPLPPLTLSLSKGDGEGEGDGPGLFEDAGGGVQAAE